MLVRNVQISSRNLRIDVAIGEEDVFPAIVVEIGKSGAETQVFTVDSQSAGYAGVLKSPVPVSAVLGRKLI